VIRRPHGNGDVSDFSVDFILSTRPGLIGENLLHTAFVGNKVGFAVPGDKPSEPLAHVQEPELCPQIHQTVAAGCTRQAYDTLHGWPHLQEALEPFCLPAFKGRQLVDHNHVIPEGQAAVFHQPLHVFPVDDVQEGRPHQRCQTFLFGADRHTVAQILQMIPLLNFRRPCVLCHPQRSDYQHPADLKGIQAQLLNSGQRDHALAKAHIQQDGCFRVRQDEIRRVRLIIMGHIFHPAHLRSVQDGLCNTPETQATPAVFSALPAAGAGAFPALSVPQTQRSDWASVQFGREHRRDRD